jgi:hypothetical protein
VSGTRVEQDDDGMSVYRKCMNEDLLALRNILHCSVVDATGLGYHDLLQTMSWMVDVALSCVLPWSGALLSEVAGTTIVEAGGGGGSQSWWR